MSLCIYNIHAQTHVTGPLSSHILNNETNKKIIIITAHDESSQKQKCMILSRNVGRKHFKEMKFS